MPGQFLGELDTERIHPPRRPGGSDPPPQAPPGSGRQSSAAGSSGPARYRGATAASPLLARMSTSLRRVAYTLPDVANLDSLPGEAPSMSLLLEGAGAVRFASAMAAKRLPQRTRSPRRARCRAAASVRPTSEDTAPMRWQAAAFLGTSAPSAVPMRPGGPSSPRDQQDADDLHPCDDDAGRKRGERDAERPDRQTRDSGPVLVGHDREQCSAGKPIAATTAAPSTATVTTPTHVTAYGPRRDTRGFRVPRHLPWLEKTAPIAIPT